MGTNRTAVTLDIADRRRSLAFSFVQTTASEWWKVKFPPWVRTVVFRPDEDSWVSFTDGSEDTYKFPVYKRETLSIPISGDVKEVMVMSATTTTNHYFIATEYEQVRDYPRDRHGKDGNGNC